MGRKSRDTVPFKGAPLVLMVCQNAVIKTVFLSNLTGKEDDGRDQQQRQGCQNAKGLYGVSLT